MHKSLRSYTQSNFFCCLLRLICLLMNAFFVFIQKKYIRLGQGQVKAKNKYFFMELGKDKKNTDKQGGRGHRCYRYFISFVG